MMSIRVDLGPEDAKLMIEGLKQMSKKRMYGEQTKRRTYTVTDKDHESLRRLGRGNASAGIRDAIKQSEKENEK